MILKFLKRFFQGQAHKPKDSAGPRRSPPIEVNAPTTENKAARVELAGPPESDSPMVMYSRGKTMFVVDRMFYEYRAGLTRGTDPSQAKLGEVLAKVSRLRVLNGGMMRDKALGVEVLLDTRDRAEIAAFRAALRIDESRESFGHCACLGGPTVECYEGRSLAATLSFHHGHGLRWSRWKHDARLLDATELNGWFQRHHIDADPGKGSEDPMQLQLLSLTEAERLAYRANSHLERGELLQAMEGCEEAVRLDKKCALAFGVRALVHRAEERAAECERDCDTAIGLGLQHPEAYFTRAVARHSKGDLTGAEADCNAGLALAPEHARLYNARGLIRANGGRVDEAATDFSKAIELSPKWPAPLGNRARLRVLADALPLAVDDYTAAITILESTSEEKNVPHTARDGNPLAFYYSQRGWALCGMGDLDAADEDFDRAVEVDPEDPRGLLSRASSHSGRVGANRQSGIVTRRYGSGPTLSRGTSRGPG